MGKKKKYKEYELLNLKVKRKNKDKKNFKKLDKAMEKSYDMLLDEIKDINMEFVNVDMKAKKRAKKKAKGDEKLFNKLYKEDKKRREVRLKKLDEMRGGDLLDRINYYISDCAPLISVGGRLIGTMILLILSLDSVKVKAEPTTLERLKALYKAVINV
jgi:hypothetical protein